MRNVNLSILYSARELATICNDKEKLKEINDLIGKEESSMKENLSETVVTQNCRHLMGTDKD